ncbi:MAG: glycosyltransferase family 4 protein [Saprospiraceae bacterium]
MPPFDETLTLEKPEKATANKQRVSQKVLFLNSHPIQYFAPLYQEIASRKDLDLTVLYCSRHGLSGETDREFGVQVKWDIPVLEGYRSVFLNNNAWKPGIYGFFGLINLGIIRYLFKAPKSTLVVHGWGYFTNILAIVFGKIAGHIVCIRGESPASHEGRRSVRSMNIRKFVFGKILFQFADYFLYIGNENKQFYKIYGVPERKLRFAPYAVDNERFSKSFQQLAPQKNDLRKALGIPLDKTVILFSGKYIEKKRPLDLLMAFHQSKKRENACLVFMGEGELRPVMERFIEKNNLQNIRLTGFINQSAVPEYYAAADLFVMCSQEGETWGLSTNEAMNFRLPVLLSDLTGSSADLVRPGENGYVFKTGDIDDFAEKLDLLLSVSPDGLKAMGKVSSAIIKGYSYQQIISSILQSYHPTIL